MRVSVENWRLFIYFTPRVYLEAVNEWRVKNRSNDIRGYNIHLFKISFGKKVMLDLVEVSITILGFELSLKINYFEQ